MNILICVRCAANLKEFLSLLDAPMLFTLERRECICCRDFEQLFYKVEVTLFHD
jgi:hypothetical protein